MLPARHRLRSSTLFAAAVKQGVRRGRPAVVVHALRPHAPTAGGVGPSQVGFVVSKRVGNAVTRNRVKRRLRHLVRACLDGGATPDGLLLVVRALPAAAALPAQRLAEDLAGAWEAALRALPDGTDARLGRVGV